MFPFGEVVDAEARSVGSQAGDEFLVGNPVVEQGVDLVAGGLREEGDLSCAPVTGACGSQLWGGGGFEGRDFGVLDHKWVQFGNVKRSFEMLRVPGFVFWS